MSLKHQYQVGDEAWLVPGFQNHFLIAVKVKILQTLISDDFPAYIIDEPVLYPILEYQLTDRRTAENELKKRTIETLAYYMLDNNEEGIIDYKKAVRSKITLSSYREAQIKFSKHIAHHAGINYTIPSLPFKVENFDWFTVPVMDEEILSKLKQLETET